MPKPVFTMDTRKLIELLRATIEADQVQRKQAEEQLTQVYETTTDHVLAANSQSSSQHH